MTDRGAVKVTTPQTGDLVFFTYSHVEIVTKVVDGVVYSAGGNNDDPDAGYTYHDNGCCKGEHIATSISYYLRPAYVNSNYGPDAPSSIEITGYDGPQKDDVLALGANCGLYGTIVSTHPLSKVWGGVYNRDGSKVGDYCYCSESTSVRSYSLRGTFNNSIISSNTSVATVSDNGLVKAVGSGTAVITAKTAIGGRVASCKITVAESSIQLDKSSVDLYVGATATLSATVVPAGSAVTWKSADTSIATVSGGKITAVAAGSTTVTASITVNGKSYTASCPVKVTKPSITLSNSTLSLYIAGTSTLTATTVPSGQTVTWKSDNTSVATVSAGKITAVAEGTANITATITVNEKSYSATCKVTVTKPTIIIDQSSLSAFIGDTATITATMNPTGQTITWKSSNTGVATVNSSGKITAVAAGTTNITASITVNGKTYNSSACAVTVKTPTVTWSKSSDSSSDTHVYYSGGNFYAYVYTLPTCSANVFGGSTTFSVVSGNATVSGGKLYINQPGTIKVRATLTYQGKTHTSDFTYTRTVTFYAGSAFNMRSGQGTSYKTVGSIPKGVTLTVTELGYSDSKYVWGKVTYNGTTGWVALWLRDRSESGGIITV